MQGAIENKKMIFSAGGKVWDLSEKVLVMGVINITPDSFSDGGECLDPRRAGEKAAGFEKEGADILDLGAESSRPGASGISAEEELSRLLPALKAVREVTGIPVSVDTTKSAVAEEALKCGACIVNDVSGLRSDARLAEAVTRHGAGVILMHRRGDPRTMQTRAVYQDLIAEIKRELKESIDIAIAAGISYGRIAIDPGIGFAKTWRQNLSLIKHLAEFRELGHPIVIGPSRKSFIGEVTGESVGDRVFGTAAAVALGAYNGAKIFRVHDVAEMKNVIRMAEAVRKAD